MLPWSSSISSCVNRRYKGGGGRIRTSAGNTPPPSWASSGATGTILHKPTAPLSPGPIEVWSSTKRTSAKYYA